MVIECDTSKKDKYSYLISSHILILIWISLIEHMAVSFQKIESDDGL